MKNGFDLYLEFQFHQTGSFYTALFDLISHADPMNIHRLALGFPDEVEAYRVFTQVGLDEFLAKCTPDHPLIEQMRIG